MKKWINMFYNISEMKKSVLKMTIAVYATFLSRYFPIKLSEMTKEVIFTVGSFFAQTKTGFFYFVKWDICQSIIHVAYTKIHMILPYTK